MGNTTYITAEGLKKLNDELNQLKSVERPNISKQIAEARDKGDLSENAEYDAAKEAQGLLEMKISILQDKIINARVIDESVLQTETVQIMNKIRIKNLKTNTEMAYTIVSEAEADLKSMKLAVNTPIAKGLLGKKVGDIAEITVPNGTIQLEILEISL
jgi:transcription elongation factor GreA